MTILSKIFVLLVMSMSVIACGVTANLEVDENYSYLTVGMEEADVQSLFEMILNSDGEASIEDPVVDLRPDAIFLSGMIIGDAGERTPGSLELITRLDNGELIVELESVDFGPFAVNSTELTRINEEIAAGLREAMQNNTDDSELTMLQVDDNAISFTIRSPRDE